MVRPDGRISLPLVPDIIASGKTPAELGKDIEARLKEYVKEPMVSVIVNGFVGPAKPRRSASLAKRPIRSRSPIATR